MSELQKAVSDAERKAHEMISAERSKMERALAEAKRQASEDALTVINQQEDSSEVSITDPLPTLCPTLLSSFFIYLLSHLLFQSSLAPSITPHFIPPFLPATLYCVIHAAGCSWFGAAPGCHHNYRSSPVVCVNKSRQMVGARCQAEAITEQLTTTCW